MNSKTNNTSNTMIESKYAISTKLSLGHLVNIIVQ